MLGTTWGTGQVLLDILWFFLIFIEVWLIITIFVDIFRRHDMKGWLKAVWIILVILVPLAGIVLYLIIYGNEMRVHAIQASHDQDAMFRDYLRHVGGPSPSEELSRLADLKAKGVINDEEFGRLKAKVIGS